MATGPERPPRTEVAGHIAHKDPLQKRLRRIEGQVRGLQRMLDEERWCPDILVQISAVQAALDKVALVLAEDHARHHVLGGPPAEAEERTTELMAAMERLVRRS